MVSIQTLILCSNALILWNGCCGWRNEDSQPAVTAVSDASREAMMLVWRSRVHSGVIVFNGGEQPRLLLAADTDRGTMALPTGDLSTQSLYQIKQASMYTFTSPGHCATIKSVSSCLKIGHRGIQKGRNYFDLAEQDNRLFENDSEDAYQSAATVTALVGWNLAV